MGNHFGTPPFLLKGALREVRGPDILPMPRRDLQVIETGLGIVGQAPARFGKGPLILCEQRLSPTFHTSLLDLKHFCVPMAVLYPLRTIRGDCYARPTRIA